ncbi:MAG: hypothetical protein HY290_11405, partial [Planctomycetia bacterium]|nr:hypothetical protein [Planctomycetia bacterium]
LIAEYFQSLDDDDSSADEEKAPESATGVDNSNVNRVAPVANGAPPAAQSLVSAQFAAASARPNVSSWDGSVVDHLRSKSHEELVDLVCSLLQRFSELRAEVRDRIGGAKPPHKN